MLALALVVSIAGLVVGPLVASRVTHGPRGMLVLDAITLALVPGVILTRLLPHLIQEGGAAPVVGLVGGYVGFQLLEASTHRRASRLGVALVLPALAVHAFFDGATLGLALGGRAGDVAGPTLIGAVLLHRVPEGLFVGSIMARSPRSVVWLSVLLLTSLTVIGALVGDEVAHALPHEVSHVGIAVGLGIMVRMVVDRHGDEVDADARTQLACGTSFAACLVLLVVVPNAHDVLGTATAHELALREALVPLFLETAPLLFVMLALSTLGGTRIEEEPKRRDRDTWASSTLLAVLLLGPWFGLVRLALSPLARLALGRLREPAWWLPRARDVLPTYTVAVVIGSLAEATIPTDWMLGVPELLVVTTGAIVAIVVPIGAGAPVLGAVLLHKGTPVSVVLVLLVAAALQPFVTTPPRRWLAMIAASLAALALPRLVSIPQGPELHAVGAHSHAGYEWGLGIALACWIVFDLARAGPRTWLRSTPPARPM